MLHDSAEPCPPHFQLPARIAKHSAWAIVPFPTRWPRIFHQLSRARTIRSQAQAQALVLALAQGRSLRHRHQHPLPITRCSNATSLH